MRHNHAPTYVLSKEGPHTLQKKEAGNRPSSILKQETGKPVKNHTLIVVILVLMMASTTNPLAARANRVPATTVNYRSSEHEGIPLLVEGVDDFGQTELGFLANFGTVTTVAGRVAVLHTQSQDLPSIAQLPFVSGIERSWPLHVYLDKSVPDVGANTVWDQVRDQYGRNVTGQGVVIGFVDTGIDVYHPDFTFPNGSTKILYVWDQTIRGRSPAGFGYGYECTSNDIEAKSCPEEDTFGHGTHVAGIAASSGRATGNYTGVAPDAGIIFVKSGHEICDGASWAFDSSQILDGINYIIERAAQLGRRAVINLSLGGNIGGHDGSDPWEIALDEIVKAGTAVVVAAGNQAQDNSHIRGQLTKGANVTLGLSVMESTTDLAIDIWYSQLDEINAILTTPSGRTYTIPTLNGDKTAQYGNVTAFTRSAENGNELFFEVNSLTQLPTDGWSISLRASQVSSTGSWDAWVDTSSCVFPGAVFLPGNGYEIDRNITIGIPGTAHNVVTVGAYVTKTSWVGMNGQTFGSKDLGTGGIASFSSLGPTRDGRIKPDIVAPGMLIASARSNATASRTSDPDLYHRILAGTSMAAPHVAGVIALMFQYTPQLQATALPIMLKQSARFDPTTGLLNAGSPVWGFGKVDVRAATGLFRLTLVLNGVPKGIGVPIQIDNTDRLSLAGGSWIDFYFQKGTIHTIALENSVHSNDETAYQLTNGEFIVISDSHYSRNYTHEELPERMSVNRTGYLIADYEIVLAASPLILVLPSLTILVLGLAAFTLGFERYTVNRRKHQNGSSKQN